MIPFIQILKDKINDYRNKSICDRINSDVEEDVHLTYFKDKTYVSFCGIPLKECSTIEELNQEINNFRKTYKEYLTKKHLKQK